MGAAHGSVAPSSSETPNGAAELTLRRARRDIEDRASNPGSFLSEARCGEPVGLDGEPDLAVICEGCDRLAREAGGDSDGWVTTIADVRLELRAAA